MVFPKREMQKGCSEQVWEKEATRSILNISYRCLKKNVSLMFHPILLDLLFRLIVLKQTSKLFLGTELLLSGFLVSPLENELTIKKYSQF